MDPLPVTDESRAQRTWHEDRADTLSEHELQRIFPGASEMARLMRAMDWSTTGLGSPGEWPTTLRTALQLCLTSRIPIVMYWGPDFTVLYNDPYISFLGETKHPRCLGRPGREVWSEIWDTIGPMLRSVYETAEATWSEDVLMFFARRLPLEEVHVRFTFGPILSEDGTSVEGIFCPCTETTEQVVGARRLETLGRIGLGADKTKSLEDACREAAEVLESNPSDIPFAAIYICDQSADTAGLAATARLQKESCSLPARVSREESQSSLGPLARALQTSEPQEIASLGSVAASLPAGEWEEKATQALVLPIAGAERLSGLLLVGLSPRQVLDPPYRTFFDLIAGHISTAVTNAQAFEAERKRAEALAALDRAKTAFFSNVSHEFRTPLTLMLGPIEDMLAKLPEGVPPDERRALTVVHRNGQRLLKLVNTLLDFARIEAGRAQASYEATDLAALTADLASNFRAACEQAGLRLCVECPPLEELAFVDREMWEKIVLNLMSNAFKFTFEGEIAVQVRETDEHFELTVRDTGTGIPAEALPRLFQRFHRVEGARGRSHEGSGIGLALVLELVKLHAGSIGARSAPHGGTTFTVSIPKGSAHLPEERVKPEHLLASTGVRAGAYVEEAISWLPPGKSACLASTPVGAQHVLVADDNADMREYARRLLAERYDVVTVGDGDAALAAARRRRPDLVVADVMMPRLDGFGLIRELRADQNLRTVPVLVLSARAGEEAVAEGLGRGADDYLAKPFSARELLVRAGALLQSAELRRQALEQERRSAEQTRASLEETQALLSALPVGVFIARDAACHNMTMNPAGAAMLRVPQAANPSKTGPARDRLPFRVLQNGAEVTDEELPMQRAARLGRPVMGEELELSFDDGTSTSLFEHAVPLFDAAGTARGCVGVFLDVTERKQTERLMAEQSRLLELIATGCPLEECLSSICAAVPRLSAGARACVLLADAERLTFPRSITPDLSPSFAMGVKDAPISDLAIGTCSDIAGDPKWSTMWRDLCVSHGVLACHSEPIVGPDGTALGSFMLCFDRAREPSDWETRLARFGVHVASIAFERDRLSRARLELIERLRDSDRRKDEFLATLSHELRNPLAPLRNSLSLLRLAGDQDAARAPIREMMERQVNHLVRLVDDLLEMSRISHGRFELRRQPVEVAVIVRNAVETTQPLIDARRHRLNVSIPDEPLWVDGDPVRLAQILANLLNNAAKYTDAGGEISVQVRREDARIAMTVGDNGIGFVPEALPGIFEMFGRGGHTNRQGPSGLGIGLALARRLAEMHGGTVTARSEGEQKGSEFTVRLPLISQQDAPTPATEHAKPSIPPRRVLVVDDNDDAADSLSMVLRFLGADVRVARSGPEAVETFGSYDPSVVLLDIGMPGMDGYEAARCIRTRYPDRRPLIVALTGWGQEEDRRRASEAGFDHHLVKPADVSALQALMAWPEMRSA